MFKVMIETIKKHSQTIAWLVALLAAAVSGYGLSQVTVVQRLETKLSVAETSQDKPVACRIGVKKSFDNPEEMQLPLLLNIKSEEIAKLPACEDLIKK